MLASIAADITSLAQSPPATDPATLDVAPGFKVELIYTVPKDDEGSWVALTVDPKGRILASDQYGTIYRITPPPVGQSTGAQIEDLAIDLTNEPVPAGARPSQNRRDGESPPPAVGAQGLLYAFDSLFVMVNENRPLSGLWRLRDTNGDDHFDEVRFLREINGSGEHGPHALVASPDGRTISFIAGNMTSPPKNLEKSRPVAWDEDHLLRRMWDARGHARDIYAPGGYVGRIHPDGTAAELIAMGFRNAYDMAYDQNGELFTYDSDMEWDQGTPWYVPTRINHVVDAGDYGWRSGAGRWPDYYADSLPSALDIGPGSPTGTVFGSGARFPEKYQRALFAADWTYGTLYAIHLTPDGATFRGEKEEFVAGKPLPLTDVVVNPHDGALYFAVGGRRTQSALYRVTYTGTANTAPAEPLAPTPGARLRRSLEALHAEGTGPEAIDIAWPHLASPDRFIRFAARAAIERQLPTNWAERALLEEDPTASIEALIALARVGPDRYQPRILNALARLDLARQPAALRLPLLRAWQLAFTRMGKPDPATCARLAALFDPLFPNADPLVNRELVSLLVFFDSPTVVAKTVPLLRVAEPAERTAEQLGGDQLIARNDQYGAVVQRVGDHRPDRQQIAYAYALRCASVGWTPELRREFFSWFPRTSTWQGGASFSRFLNNIRTESLALVDDSDERAMLARLSQPPPHSIVPGAVTPEGPGRAYTVDDAMALMPDRLTARNFARGKAMFAATACAVCHRFNGEGADLAPELSGAGNRYSVRDLLENIIEPSRVISDQYGSEQVETTDGEIIVGRVVGEEQGRLVVMTNPFDPDDVRRIRTEQVLSRQPYPVSLMPPGLLNALNADELKDLIAYILSGGKAADAMFQPLP